MKSIFKLMFKGAQCGAMTISFFILTQILINPTHMVLLYEFNIPLLILEVIVFGTVVTLSFIELGFYVKKERKIRGVGFSKGNFFLVLSIGVFMTGIGLWLQELGIFT